MKSKIFVALAILSMFFQCVPANVFAATSATPTVTTSVVIKDGNNDKILEEYELDTATTKKSVDENGNIVYTTTTTASDASNLNNNSRATQNNSKTFYGWKGKVSINYYDKYPYGKPQTDEVARGSGNREYGCRRLREKLPNFSGVSFF